MKKMFTFIFLITISSSIFAQLSWCGESYIVGDLNGGGSVWYNGSATAQPSNFNGQVFNSVISFKIGGEVQSFNTEGDNATLGWAIKSTSGSGGTIFDSGTLNLPYLEPAGANDKWQEANNGNFIEVIDALKLSPGTTYYLHIWFYVTDIGLSITVYDSNSGANYVATINTSGALPVELTSFTANKVGDITELNWTTATEINNYGFEVMSSDDNINWANIGFVEGHGNSNSPKEYSFVVTDNSVAERSLRMDAHGRSYRLKQIDTDGGFEYSDVVEVEGSLNYKLSQNHPNPFNPTTTINFTIPEAAKVNITIYNALGQEVTKLANREFGAGNHTVEFNASNYTSGLYFYRLESSNFSKTMKMLLLK